MPLENNLDTSANSSVLPFYSAYRRPATIPSVAGSKEIPDLYLKVIDGEEHLVQKSVTDPKTKNVTLITRDIYTPKQEALEGTYLPRMIERFLNGSISPEQFEVFKNPHAWTDIDVTSAPKNLAEALQLQIDAENAFNSLDPKLRELFGDNKFKFIQAMEDGTAVSRLQAAGFIKPSAQTQSKDPVVKKEGVSNE